MLIGKELLEKVDELGGEINPSVILETCVYMMFNRIIFQGTPHLKLYESSLDIHNQFYS